MGERCYVDLESRDGELVHEYGDHVHLIRLGDRDKHISI